ncbi:hypothetical protein LCGC14_3079840, partial [marine sediment metagenome]
ALGLTINKTGLTAPKRIPKHA